MTVGACVGCGCSREECECSSAPYGGKIELVTRDSGFEAIGLMLNRPGTRGVGAMRAAAVVENAVDGFAAIKGILLHVEPTMRYGALEAISQEMDRLSRVRLDRIAAIVERAKAALYIGRSDR